MNITSKNKSVNTSQFNFDFSQEEVAVFAGQIYKSVTFTQAVAALELSFERVLWRFLCQPADCPRFKFNDTQGYTPIPDGTIENLKKASLPKKPSGVKNGTSGTSDGTIPSPDTSDGRKTQCRNSTRAYRGKMGADTDIQIDFENGGLLTERTCKEKALAEIKNAMYVYDRGGAGDEVVYTGTMPHGKTRQMKKKVSFLNSWNALAPCSENALYVTATLDDDFPCGTPSEKWERVLSQTGGFIRKMNNSLFVKTFLVTESDSAGNPHLHFVVMDNAKENPRVKKWHNNLDEFKLKVLWYCEKYLRGLVFHVEQWSLTDIPEYLLKQYSYSVTDVAKIEEADREEKKTYMKECATLWHWLNVFNARGVYHPACSKNISSDTSKNLKKDDEGGKVLKTLENNGKALNISQKREDYKRIFSECVKKTQKNGACKSCLMGIWLERYVLHPEKEDDWMELWEFRELLNKLTDSQSKRTETEVLRRLANGQTA